jgi:hypothetical protein
MNLAAPLLVLSSFLQSDTPAGSGVDYVRDVKPILAGHCYACHGAVKQRGGLRVDTAAFLHEGGDNGPAISPGKSGDSMLVRRLLGQDDLPRMPPAKDGDALKPAQVAMIRKWIDQGAAVPKDERPETDPKDHWAFRPPTRPAVPSVKNTGWVRNPVDAFLVAEHEKRGLTPQAPAEKSLLLRRVYLDLIGLPPTRAELAAFLSDPSDDAYEKVVDQLLARPQYGERWGRHWMDVWRYSDWWGLGQELRNSQKHIWHWRDWIVESLNRDKGYDRMLLEMLAADELYPTDADALRGTGFLARHYFKFNRTTWLDETIEHTGKAFLGLTLNCAKCHDHKYDPISQVDYYRFRALFEPYQIRLDQVPGETDYEKDGVPRVFDCNLVAPTYLHVRGNEQQPDKERKITPGIPKFFAPDGLDIQPIKLPPEAHNPGLRPFVLDDHVKAAERQLATAREQLASAKQRLAALEKNKTEPAKPAPKELVRDAFATLDNQIWEIVSGDWKIESGKLAQKQTGAMRTALRLKQTPPTDFEARVKFAILGGETYHSVGLSFDVGGEHESLVYLTAHAADPRVQLAYKRAGTYVYPPDAKQSRKVALKQPQEMTIRVRNSLLNVAVNGQHAFAYQLPNGRHPGHIDLIAFDAAARFDEFTLSTLPADAVLVNAGNKAAVPTTAAQARAAVAVAEKTIAEAESGIAALKARAAADRASEAQRKALAQRAAKAEKEHAVATAELALAKAVAKGDAAAVKSTRAAVETARKAAASPGEQYTPLAGALKTLESNLETEASRRKPFPTTSTGRRSALAKWVADRKNPLTARVAVNHVWARHFGQPLVASVFDFGRKGTPPTHPELLDWLAVEFMDGPSSSPRPAGGEGPGLRGHAGWSMKHLHKLIVTSSAYRMSSAGASAENRAKDPDNRYLWHMNSQRMESQVVRDCLLALGGDLDLTQGGPTVATAQQEASRRRSLYFFSSAIERNRFLMTFDDADPLDCYRRRESIIPQQALALSNSKLALSMAEKITERMAGVNAKRGDGEFIREAYLTLLAYEPDRDEIAACQDALARWREILRGRPDADRQARRQLVHALLNHNDFVTIR